MLNKSIGLNFTKNNFNIVDVTNDEYKSVVNRYGDVVFMKESLIQKLEEEASTWHWTPWLPTRTKVLDNYVYEVPCIEESSVDSFPDSLFTGTKTFLCTLLKLFYIKYNIFIINLIIFQMNN